MYLQELWALISWAIWNLVLQKVTKFKLYLDVLEFWILIVNYQWQMRMYLNILQSDHECGDVDAETVSSDLSWAVIWTLMLQKVTKV
jgi:hypothetical protein